MQQGGMRMILNEKGESCEKVPETHLKNTRKYKIFDQIKGEELLLKVKIFMTKQAAMSIFTHF